MLSKRLSIVVVTVLLNLIALSANAKEHRTERVVMIGDSQAGGLGPHMGDLIQHFKFVSHRGSKASNWLTPKNRKWSAWIEKENPSLILVVLGTNEAMSKKKSNAFAKNMQTLSEHLASLSQGTVIWVTPPQLDKPAYLKTVRDAASKIPGIAMMDFSQKRYILRDGVHLYSSGYKQWAEDIVKRLP